MSWFSRHFECRPSRVFKSEGHSTVRANTWPVREVFWPFWKTIGRPFKSTHRPERPFSTSWSKTIILKLETSQSLHEQKLKKSPIRPHSWGKSPDTFANMFRIPILSTINGAEQSKASLHRILTWQIALAVPSVCSSNFAAMAHLIKNQSKSVQNCIMGGKATYNIYVL